MTPAWPWLLGWGTLVGLDLVSVGQVMISRPLVAATVAGAIAGDPVAGGMVGVVLELFALEVLPVGAVRYPDYGLGAVAGVAAAVGAPHVLGVGLAVTVALLVAYAGEWARDLVRWGNTTDVRRHRVALDEGAARAILAVHVRGLLRDGARSLAVAGVGLALAWATTRWPPVTARGALLLTVATLGAALGTAAVGAMRVAGRGPALRWFVTGLSVGVVWVAIA